MIYIRHANKDPKRVHTFYVPSTSRTGEHTVKRVTRYGKRRSYSVCWYCNCEDFFHRQLHTGGYCKHIRTIADFVTSLGGISKFPRGTTTNVPDAEGSRDIQVPAKTVNA